MAAITELDQPFVDAINDAAIKEVTKTMYKANIRRISNILNQSIAEYLKTPQTTYNKLIMALKDTETGNINSKSLKLLVATIMAIMKHSMIKQTDRKLFTKWYGIHMAISKKVDDEEISSVAQGRLKDGYILWEEVIEARDILAKKTFASRDHLIMAIYTFIPPRRQEDYYRVQILNSSSTLQDPEASGVIYMYKSPPVMEIFMYKTAKTYNNWSIDIPIELLDIIKHSLQTNPRDYLFIQQDGAPYKGNNPFRLMTNRVFKRLFGESVTLNSIRHAGAQQNLLNARKSMADQHKYAQDMGHKYETHQRYRKIIPDEYQRRNMNESLHIR
jgi:hypothetical protein